METRAPFIIVGAFLVAAIAAAFGFVYWLHNSTGMVCTQHLSPAIRRAGAGIAGRRFRAVQTAFASARSRS